METPVTYCIIHLSHMLCLLAVVLKLRRLLILISKTLFLFV